MILSIRKILLVLSLALIAGAIVYFESQRPKTMTMLDSTIVPPRNNTSKEAMYDRAKEITSPDGFINTEEITIAEHVGKKVVLVDFWTYSCINCQRTTPYLNAWYEKYGDQGLQIVGIHTPEFEFEKDYNNVKAATAKFGIEFPVVLDNDYSTWRAYKNRYWPRKYLIDIDGFIVYDHIGEGAYDETEKKIQELLQERSEVLGSAEPVPQDLANPENVETVDASRPRSPEIYFGSARNSHLANGTPGVNVIQNLSIPSEVLVNQLYLSGTWDFQREYAQNQNAGKITFRFQGKSVNLVASAENPIEIKISQDGKLIKTLTVQEDGLYRLIENAAYGEHLLEIEIGAPGLRAFTFTFG